MSTTTVVGSTTVSSTTVLGNLESTTTSAEAQAKPSSLLTVLPGEGVGSLVATLSPLLVGLLIAALVYGAYSRRQDASS